MNLIRLSIEAIESAGSITSMQSAAQTVPGVLSVRTDPTGRIIEVEAAETVTASDLIGALQRAGFEAVLAG